MSSVLNTPYFIQSSKAYDELTKVQNKLSHGQVSADHVDTYRAKGRFVGGVVGDTLMAVPRVVVGCSPMTKPTGTLMDAHWCAADQGVWGALNKLVLNLSSIAGGLTFGVLGLVTSPVGMMIGCGWDVWTDKATEWGFAFGANLAGCAVGLSELARGTTAHVLSAVVLFCGSTGALLGDAVGGFRDLAVSTAKDLTKTVPNEA